MTVDELLAKLDAEYDRWSDPKYKGFTFIWMRDIRDLQAGIRSYVKKFEERVTP